MVDVKRFYQQILVLRCQAGDEAAFRELVELFSARLHYYLRKLLGSVDRADDVLQDVWLDVFRSVSKLEKPAAFSTWLYRIARDRAYRDLRRPRPKTLENYDVIDAAGQETDFSADDAEQIHALLDQLAPEHREVLLLRFIEDMSYQDIAEVTGCRVGTVRSRIHYAKRALKASLKKERQHEWEEELG